MKRVFFVTDCEFAWVPGRVPTETAAKILGFLPEHMPLLAKKGCKPLGSPPPTGPKWYALKTLLQLVDDPAWLARASDSLVRASALKNQHRNKKRNGSPSNNAEEAARNGKTNHPKRTF
jgi:hypothetical protein